jgi:hypothetical protein
MKGVLVRRLLLLVLVFLFVRVSVIVVLADMRPGPMPPPTSPLYYLMIFCRVFRFPRRCLGSFSHVQIAVAQGCDYSCGCFGCELRHCHNCLDVRRLGGHSCLQPPWSCLLETSHSCRA